MMWSRNKDLLSKKPQTKTITDRSGPSTSQSSVTSTSSPSDSKIILSDKRKRPNEDKDDDEEGEYLRRKHRFIKSSITTDYQPDICKDYKETGFCGFGDSCKFLHDRSDYKAGWKIDQEWAKGQYEDEDDDKYLIKDEDDEQAGDSNNSENEDVYDYLIQCSMCKEPYKEPIVLKCKHYFCMVCAEKDCNDNCPTCSEPTLGIFKSAKKLLARDLEERESKKTNKKS